MALLDGSIPAFIALMRSLSIASMTLYMPGINWSFIDGEIGASSTQRQYSVTRYCMCRPASSFAFLTSSLSSLRRLLDDRAAETVGLHIEDRSLQKWSAEDSGNGSVEVYIHVGNVLPNVVIVVAAAPRSTSIAFCPGQNRHRKSACNTGIRRW